MPSLLASAGLFQRRHDPLEAGADPAVVGAAGGEDQDVGRHLGGKLDGAVGDLFAVGDDDELDRHSAAPTAARRIRALETAPGSRWPMLRSPR